MGIRCRSTRKCQYDKKGYSMEEGSIWKTTWSGRRFVSEEEGKE